MKYTLQTIFKKKCVGGRGECKITRIWLREKKKQKKPKQTKNKTHTHTHTHTHASKS